MPVLLDNSGKIFVSNYLSPTVSHLYVYKRLIVSISNHSRRYKQTTSDEIGTVDVPGRRIFVNKHKNKKMNFSRKIKIGLNNSILAVYFNIYKFDIFH